jgi:hypothetical protein
VELARDRRVLEALARLSEDSEFVVVLNALEEELRVTLLTMTTARDETSLRWLQGEAQTLGSLVDLARKANEIVHKMQSQ